MYNITWGAQNTYVPIVFNSAFGDFGWVRQQSSGDVWHQFNVERSGNHIYFKDIHTGATHTICANDQGRSQFVQWNGDTNAGTIDGGQYYPGWTTQNLHGYSIKSGPNSSRGTRVNITFRDPLKAANQMAHQVTMYTQNTYVPQNALIRTPLSTITNYDNYSATCRCIFYVQGTTLYQRTWEGGVMNNYIISNNITGQGWDMQSTVTVQQGSWSGSSQPRRQISEAGNSIQWTAFISKGSPNGTISIKEMQLYLWDRATGNLLWGGKVNCTARII